MNHIEQGTDAWRKSRLGRATGSKFADIMAGPTRAGWKNYRAQLTAERTTGVWADGYKSTEMMWGTEMEPLARLYYTLRSGTKAEECGFFIHEEIAAGASPDGLIGDDGILEIKNPNTATHIGTLRTGKIPNVYIPQVQGQMWITGRQWADFVSFDVRLGENAKYICIRVNRDDAYISQLEANVRKFLAEVDDEVKFVENYGKEG